MQHPPNQDIYTEHWKIARQKALKQGFQIVEQGWEQHVIIDATANIVYRYPRRAEAAAKLADEVAVLKAIHEQRWPIELPVMREHNEIFTSYSLIVGEVLDNAMLERLTDNQRDAISYELGAFMVLFHHFDPTVVQHKKTKQTTTLLEYYTERINDGSKTAFFEPAQRKLQRLSKTINAMKSVVVHGDLHGLNIVINSANTLQGVIDLSEMEIGDPHQDFRKLFMTDSRLLEPALTGYHQAGGQKLDADTVKTWAYVNEWANLCHFAETPENPTYQRAWHHLKQWGQL
jgi:aminoglycoside phosphotransferase (APT) family kinase protein